LNRGIARNESDEAGRRCGPCATSSPELHW
jgi:hypothetical protein